MITRNLRPNKLCCNLNSRPGNRAFGAHHWNIHKIPPVNMKNKNDGKIWIMTYLGAQNDPEIRPLRSIFNTPLNTPHQDWWACEAIRMWKQWKLVEKVIKYQNCDLCWGSKCPSNWAFETHIAHISESSSTEHIKQDWCESRGNFFHKIFENENFGSFGDPKWPKNLDIWIFDTPTKVASINL